MVVAISGMVTAGFNDTADIFSPTLENPFRFLNEENFSARPFGEMFLRTVPYVGKFVLDGAVATFDNEDKIG